MLSVHFPVVALQRRMQSGAVDDHAGLLVVAHLLEGEGNWSSPPTLTWKLAKSAVVAQR